MAEPSVLGRIVGGAVGLGGLATGLTGRGPSPADFARMRGLHNKSFLEFHFPDPDKLVARLPFYENIDIKERKKANLVTYDPIGRSSSLYTYTGASSRVLKLSFFLTLPHIQALHEGPLVKFTPASRARTKERVKAEFLSDPTKAYVPLAESGKEPHYEVPPGVDPTQRRWWGTLPSYDENNEVDPRNEYDERMESESEEASTKHVATTAYSANWIKYVAWWVNLIRSSVLNNQSELMQGPPIIRLKHGELYNNIPCICHSYNISVDGKAGMDRRTLLSRRIKVDMDLEEFRAGNFGKYDPTQLITVERDNVAGWEAIIEHSTADPGYGPPPGAEETAPAR